MIANRDIIIFNDDWGRFPSTLQHVAKVLLENGNRVFWIGSLGLRKPKFNSKDIFRAIQKLKKMFFSDSSVTIKEELEPILINPIVFPFHDFPLVKKINSFLIVRKIKSVLKFYKSEKPLLVTSCPITDDVIGKLGESCSIYYCVDDYTNMDGAFKCLTASEQKLVNKVDAVFAVSKSLMQTRKHKQETHFAPQGVNVTHFAKSLNVNEKVRNIKKPVVGFFGLIAEWVDVELIVECAKKYPDISFVVIGKSSREINHFHSYKNIFYLGAVDYNLLPTYASIFEVGIIPFEINPVTVASNPLKMLEYFSLGIPVVTTNLPEARAFTGLAYIAKSKDEFVEMISLAINEKNELLNQERVMKANEFSWNSITQSVFNKILEIEKNKQ